MVLDAATVVIVSHNLNYQKQVCDRMLLMEGGEVVSEGTWSSCLRTNETVMS